MNYEQWTTTLPTEITDDPVWKVASYRIGLFLADISWRDVSKLMTDKRMHALADQLYRAISSISANIAEGYSYASHSNKARFYEYALGSAREGKTWYWNARHILGDEVTQHRIHMLTEIIKMLTVAVPNQRKLQASLREPRETYTTSTRQENDSFPAHLLNHIPLPEPEAAH